MVSLSQQAQYLDYRPRSTRLLSLEVGLLVVGGSMELTSLWAELSRMPLHAHTNVLLHFWMRADKVFRSSTSSWIHLA